MYEAEPVPPVSPGWGGLPGTLGVSRQQGARGAGHRMGSQMLGNVRLSGLSFLIIKVRGSDSPACIPVHPTVPWILLVHPGPASGPVS